MDKAARIAHDIDEIVQALNCVVILGFPNALAQVDPARFPGDALTAIGTLESHARSPVARTLVREPEVLVAALGLLRGELERAGLASARLAPLVRAVVEATASLSGAQRSWAELEAHVEAAGKPRDS